MAYQGSAYRSGALYPTEGLFAGVVGVSIARVVDAARRTCVGRHAAVRLAEDAGLEPRQVRNFLGGREIEAEAYLKLCACLRLPALMEGAAVPVFDGFDRTRFGRAVKEARLDRWGGMAGAKAATGIARTIWSRAENGAAVSLTNTLTLAAACGLDPMHYEALPAFLDVSRETASGTEKPRNDNRITGKVKQHEA